MRYLGLDLGTKTLGIAISDRSCMISSPLKTIKYDDKSKLIEEVLDIIKQNDITEIALGLPKNMDGSLGFAAERSLTFKEELSKKTNVNINLIDERLSTVEAESYLIDEGMRRKKRKNVIDAVAASVILDTFIRMKGNKSNEER